MLPDLIPGASGIGQEMEMLIDRLRHYHRISPLLASDKGLLVVEITEIEVRRDRLILGEFSRGWAQRPGRWP